MKSILVIFGCSLTVTLYSQNLQEWTKQKKTQIKYLVQQIAALEVYTSYSRKGMNIVNTGTQAITDLKQGDFFMHNNYFESLKNINPTITSYSKVASIITNEKLTEALCNKQIRAVFKTIQLNNDEVRYCRRVYQHLLQESSKIIGQLQQVITPGPSSLKDDERIKRIDDLYKDINDQYVFAKHFSNVVFELSVQRFIDKNNIASIRKMFGLN